MWSRISSKLYNVVVETVSYSSSIHDSTINRFICSKNVCPQCRFECSSKMLVKLYISYDSNAPSTSNNASSSSNIVVQKPANSDEKAVKLQTALNDTV